MDTSHIRHMGYDGFSDKTDVKLPDVLPVRLSNAPKPLYNGLEASTLLHRKLELMVLVEDSEPFIPNLFANTEEIWLGYDGLELRGAPSTVCAPFSWPQQTWRLACVFSSYQRVDLAPVLNCEFHERKWANGMISKSLESIQTLAERYTDWR